MADDELDLKTLADDELVEQMHDDLYDGASSASTSATAFCSCRKC
jgi:hypothetical protein